MGADCCQKGLSSMKHTYVLEFSTDGEIHDLTDLIAGRVYSLDKVVKGDVTCTAFSEFVDRIRADAEALRRRSEVQELPVYQQTSQYRG